MSFGNKNHDDQDSGFVSRNERFGVDQKKEIQPENRGSFLREALNLDPFGGNRLCAVHCHPDLFVLSVPGCRRFNGADFGDRRPADSE